MTLILTPLIYASKAQCNEKESSLKEEIDIMNPS